MKKIMNHPAFQFIFYLGIIIVIYQVGNFISTLISNFIIIPGSIIGMAILFLLLYLKIINFGKIEKATQLFMSHMGLFFVPLGVGIMVSYQLILPIIFPITITLICSCFLVMLITAKIVDLSIKKGGK